MASPAGHSRRSSSPSPTSASHALSVAIATQWERINNLDGEFHGLRAQFTDFHKNQLSPQEAQHLREELGRFRAEAAEGRAAATHAQQLQREVQQLRSELVQTVDTLRNQVRGELQQAVDALRRQVDAAQQQAGLQQDLRRLQGQVEPLAQQVKSIQASQAQGQQGLQGLKQEMTKALQGVQGSQQQGAQAKREVEQLRQEYGALKQRSEDALGKLQTAQQRAVEARRHVDQLRQEINSVKSEAQGTKGHQREQLQHMRMLEEKTRGLDEVGRLKATVASNNCEFWNLKKKLYDSGVLAPPPPPPEPDKVPVGTLELGEDIFTARLLMRLGLMKAAGEADNGRATRKDVRELRATEVSESDALSEISDEHIGFCRAGLVDNIDEYVTGLQVPEIEEGGQGYCVATTGWVAICVFTLAMQVLIVATLLIYGMEAGDDCIKEPLHPRKWYMLHVSKAAATLAAGMLMGKELMDIVNYWMVSELLLARPSIEVAVSATLRFILVFFVAAANVIIFMTLTSPAGVWINMTALSFVGELGEAILGVARRGVFGHHICKAVTSVNFSLNFMTDYPWWFSYARGLALAIAGLFIMIFAVTLFLMPDNVCNADGSSPDEGLLGRLMATCFF